MGDSNYVDEDREDKDLNIIDCSFSQFMLIYYILILSHIKFLVFDSNLYLCRMENAQPLPPPQGQMVQDSKVWEYLEAIQVEHGNLKGKCKKCVMLL